MDFVAVELKPKRRAHQDAPFLSLSATRCFADVDKTSLVSVPSD
nr:MAG TPA: hypothetical protein [Caudoviricetes sp.]